MAVTCKSIIIVLCRKCDDTKQTMFLYFVRGEPFAARATFALYVEIIYLHKCWARRICKRMAFEIKFVFQTQHQMQNEKKRIESLSEWEWKESWLVSLSNNWKSRGWKKKKNNDRKKKTTKRRKGATIMQIQLFVLIPWFMHSIRREREREKINDVYGYCSTI